MRGKLTSDTDRQGLIEYINKLDLSKVFHWEIKKHIKRRTISQNALYWLWLTCVQDETGNDRNDLHEYFKTVYLKPNIIEVFDNSVSIRSTKGLATAQFKEYLDRIQAAMIIEGITLPDPDNLIWDSFYQHYKDKL